jgi:uncharacterized protein (TIGR02996 family)
MTLLEAFLEDIIANPSDDVPRLVYADWLEEQGQGERAEFIRIQIALANWPCECTSEERVYHDECRCKEKAKLQRRELELLPRQYVATGLACDDIWFTRGFVSRVRITCDDWSEHGRELVRQHPLERVELSDKRPRWTMHIYSPRLCGWGPERLVGGTLVADGEERLPETLLNALHNHLEVNTEWYSPWWKFYSDASLAEAALSQGCLAWARSQSS